MMLNLMKNYFSNDSGVCDENDRNDRRRPVLQGAGSGRSIDGEGRPLPRSDQDFRAGARGTKVGRIGRYTAWSGVLVDTSVWIDHFRNRNAALEDLLHQDLACTHLMVIGEIACDTLPAPRSQTLDDLNLLPKVQHAGLHETMALIEREALFGVGCGLVELVLLASALITPGATLWTPDQRLANLAERFGLAHHAK